MQFIKDAQSISTEALALITTTELPPYQQAETIRFPAVYTGTNEPILLTGSLLQIGDVPVKRVTKTAEPIEDEIDTSTLRISVFADEYPQDWNLFIKAPIKTVIRNTPLLLKCTDDSCNNKCPRFHPAVDEAVDQVIQDVWSWTYATLDGRRSNIEHCVLFQANIRVPLSAASLLQATSGANGVYFDPRSKDGKSTDPNHTVIWLPGANSQEAKHKSRTSDHAIAITRLGGKYGIRVREQDEKTAWAYLRPGHDYIQVKITGVYRLFPLPHGVQRTGVAHLLRRPISLANSGPPGHHHPRGKDNKLEGA